MKRWQDDVDFVAWLKRAEYVARDGLEVMSPGVYIYMWEAWSAGSSRRRPATRLPPKPPTGTEGA